MTAPALIQKLWNTCNILRDDGLSHGVSEVFGSNGVFDTLFGKAYAPD